MQESKKPTSRKKFLLWSATIISSATVFKFIGTPKKKKNDTVKMLTQDGKLVEIDKKLLASPGKQISDKELQQWVK
ncbi:MAG: hypothetical protein Q8891_10010 [Bacteroidota bacterium]|jgi:hypothetical protein|nr:hypothetical protein [Bacteroidota bacterium]